MQYQIINIPTGICVAEYTADAPKAQFEIDPSYNTTDYETIEVGGRAVSTPVVTIWKAFEFLRRFTPEERVAIRSAAKTDALIEDGIKLLEMAPVVHSTDEDVIRLLGYFQQQNLITAERHAAILGG